MNKIELYLVKSSSGSYEDYHEEIQPIIYATLEAAQKVVEEIINIHQEVPFPFDWCTEKEFEELRYEGKITDEDYSIRYNGRMERSTNK